MAREIDGVKPGRGADVVGSTVGRGRNEQHVVEGQTEPTNFSVIALRRTSRDSARCSDAAFELLSERIFTGDRHSHFAFLRVGFEPVPGFTTASASSGARSNNVDSG